MCCTRTLRVFLCLVIVSVSAKDNVEDPEERLVKRIIKECTESKSRLWCFSDKAALFLERSIDRDIPLLDGIKLVRNEERINYQQGRSSYGFTRLKTALWNFLNTHRLSFDLKGLARRARTRDSSHQNNNNNNSQNVATHKIFYYDKGDEWSDEEKGEIVEMVYTGKGHSKGGGGKHKGGGGDHDYDYEAHSGGSVHSSDKHKSKKEKKYTYYAFMVLLGIFGLTGPLVMKTLAVIAAKALVASKMALIIVGSVLLKKLFEKDHHHPTVKVHTITADHEDEHDRLYSYGQVLPYSAYEHYNPKQVA